MSERHGPLRRGPRAGATKTGRPPTVPNTGVPKHAANPQSPDKAVPKQSYVDEKGARQK